MTNPPGEGTPPERPDEPRPEEQQTWGQPGEPQPGEQQVGGQQYGDQQPGYWEQQAQQQAQQPGQQPTWQPSYPPPGGYPAQAQYAPDHPRATTSLVLGILGVVLCQLVAPFAWWMGKKTLDEIDASQGTMGGRGAAQAGYILGIVGTVLLALGALFLVIWLVVMVAVVGGSMSNGGY